MPPWAIPNSSRWPCHVVSAAQIEEIKRTRRAAYDAEAEASKARKERMLATESTRGAVGSEFGSESEQLKAMRAEMTKSRAQTLLDEQLDEVKNMNQMMLYSKCVTIRDAQLEEKKHVKAEAAEEDETPFAERFAGLQDQLEAQFTEAEELTATIRARLAGVGL